MTRWQYPLINHLVCELDGFGGLKFLEKTGQCVYSPDIKGYFMDHCRSKAGVYVDPLLIEGKKKDYLLNSTKVPILQVVLLFQMQLWPVVHFFHSLLSGFAVAKSEWKKWATGQSCI